MSDVKKILAIAGPIVAIALAGLAAYSKYTLRSVPEVGSAQDPIKSIGDNVLQNAGPGTDVVIFVYDEVNDRVLCRQDTYFNEGERREVSTFCPDALSAHPDSEWLAITRKMFEAGRWKEEIRTPGLSDITHGIAYSATCPEDKPLRITVTNGSSRTIRGWKMSVTANYAAGGKWDTDDSYRNSEVIPPGAVQEWCWSFPKLGNTSPDLLGWEIDWVSYDLE